MVPAGVVMLPTPVWLELEMHSNCSPSVLLTITPLLPIGPDDISASEEIAYIPAPVNNIGDSIYLKQCE